MRKNDGAPRSETAATLADILSQTNALPAGLKFVQVKRNYVFCTAVLHAASRATLEVTKLALTDGIPSG